MILNKNIATTVDSEPPKTGNHDSEQKHCNNCRFRTNQNVNQNNSLPTGDINKKLFTLRTKNGIPTVGIIIDKPFTKLKEDVAKKHFSQIKNRLFRTERV